MSPREKDELPPRANRPEEENAENTLAQSLRAFTSARVSLRRTGAALATSEVLDFQRAHAEARDAVQAALDADRFADRLACQLNALNLGGTGILKMRSAAPDRQAYLRRPDLGRQLDPASTVQLSALGCDVVFVIGDGLSAVAVERHAIPLLSAILPEILRAGWRCGPICLVTQARVAIGDPIGAALGAKLSIVLIGERPGLSTPDSLGVYITWNPQPGRHDADRNCISNIGGGGLSYEAAAARLLWYMTEAQSRQATGITLKEQGNSRLSGESP
jgi:ethanolamine ammonia-lyase small subunit